MYAVIEDSGRQFKVASGDVILIDRAAPPEGQEWPTEITFDRILMVGGEGKPNIGAPLLSGASVKAQVLGPAKGRKLRVTKYNRRKGYHIERGHRQKYLRVKIADITL